MGRVVALVGRRILVTGASSGIGAATARTIVANGGSVGLLARRAGPLAELADELGDRAVAVPGDVTDPASVQAAVAAAAAHLGGLDGLVNAAGVARPSPIADGKPEDWQLTFDVNVVGLLQATQAVLAHLRDTTPADIINISSMSGRRRASVAMTVYSASKFAVHLVSEGLREELADDDIRVTLISPGFVRTAIYDDLAGDALGDRYRTAMQDKGLEPEVVADQVVSALAQPPDVSIVEIASSSSRQ